MILELFRRRRQEREEPTGSTIVTVVWECATKDECRRKLRALEAEVVELRASRPPE